eukprot:jgi/Botrbrau1/2729/Bobra.0164s0009.1
MDEVTGGSGNGGLVGREQAFLPEILDFVKFNSFFKSFDVVGAERLLILVGNGESLEQLLERYPQRGPCTNVWKGGTAAYRCRTCQTTVSSAICTPCFKAGGHEKHDFSMYISESGGCCDCGDPTSWKPSGCCLAHRPSSESPAATVPLPLHRTLELIFHTAFFRLLQLTGWVGVSGEADAFGEGVAITKFLSRLCRAPPIRAIACSAARSPLSHIFQVHEELEQLGKWNMEPGAWREARERLRGELTTYQSLNTSLVQTLSSVMFDNPHSSLVEEMTTLLLLLLYDADFKTQYTLQLLREYPAIHRGLLAATGLGTLPPSGKALDRITVQLFNTADATLELVAKHDLLGMLCGELVQMLDLVRAHFHADAVGLDAQDTLVDHGALRVMIDLSMVLNHPSVAAFLLAEEERLGKLVMGVRQYQDTHPWSRQLREHVLFESTTWRSVCGIEMQIWRWLLDPLLQMMAGRELADFGPPGQGIETEALPLPQRLRLLQSSTYKTIGETWEWVYHHPPAYERTQIYDELLRGARVSASLPLHHFTGRLVALLFAVQDPSGECTCQSENEGEDEEERREGEAGFGTDCGKAAELPFTFPRRPVHLFDCREHRQLGRGTYKATWEAISFAPLQILVWMAQVRARLWVRNGKQLERYSMLYYNYVPMAERALLPDIVLLQIWFASSADQPDRALGELLLAFGGKQLVDVARRRLPGGPEAGTPRAGPSGGTPRHGAAVSQTPFLGGQHPGSFQCQVSHGDPGTMVPPAGAEGSSSGVPSGAGGGLPTVQDPLSTSMKTPGDLGLQIPASIAGQSGGSRMPAAGGRGPTTPAGPSMGTPGTAGPGLRLPSRREAPVAAELASLMTAFPRLEDGLSSAWGNDGTRWTDERRLSVVADGMHTLLVLLRELSLYQRDIEAVLRSEVIAWLAVDDLGYSNLQTRVLRSIFTESMMNKVLAEVAEYIPYGTQTKSMYRLKKEAWRYFDPHFPRYAAHDLQAALVRAAANGWDPVWQLNQTSMEMPYPLRDLPKFLMTPLLHWTIWAALRDVEFNVAKPATHQLAIAAMCLLSEAIAYLQRSPPEDPRVPAAAAHLVHVLEGSHDCKGIRALLDVIISSEVLDQGIQRLATGAKALVTSFLASQGQKPAQGSPPESSLEQASPLETPAPGPTPDSDKREQIRRRQEQMLAEIKAKQQLFEESQMEAGSEGEGEVCVETGSQFSWTSASAGPDLEMLNTESWEDLAFESDPAKMLRYNPANFGTVKGVCVGCLDEASPECLGWVALAHVCSVQKFAHRGAPMWNEVSAGHLSHHPQVCLAPHCAADLYPATHLHCCGHLIHDSCAQTYRRQMAEQVRRQQVRRVEEGEFYCPSCRRLSNCVLPALLPDPADGDALAPLSGSAPVGPHASRGASMPLQARAPTTLDGTAAAARDAVAKLRSARPADPASPAVPSTAASLSRAGPQGPSGDAGRGEQPSQTGESEEASSGPETALDAMVQLLQEGRSALADQNDEPCSPVLPRPRKRRAGLLISNRGLQEHRLGPVAAMTATFIVDLERPCEQHSQALTHLARSRVVAPAEETVDLWAAAENMEVDFFAGGREGTEEDREESPETSEEASPSGSQEPFPGGTAVQFGDYITHLEADGDQLWATLAHQISHWEIMNRGPSAHGASAAAANMASANMAHWRATVNLAVLCQAYGSGMCVLLPGYGATLLDRVVSYLTGQDVELAADPWLNVQRALLPTSVRGGFADQPSSHNLLAFLASHCKAASGIEAGWITEERGRAGAWASLLGDPLSLLLTLYGTVLNEDSGWPSGAPAPPPPNATDAFKAFLGMMYIMASTQGLMAVFALEGTDAGPQQEGDGDPGVPVKVTALYERALDSLAKDWKFHDAVCGSLLPFLRQARLYKEVFGIDADPKASWGLPDPRILLPGCPGGPQATASQLAAALGLPDVATAAAAPAGHPNLERVLTRWLGAVPFRVPSARPWQAHLQQAVECPPTLLRLPELYQDLFVEYAKAKCVECRNLPTDERALCLQCGALLCYPSLSCVGDRLPSRNLHNHALTCGAGTAVYLMLELSRLLVVRGRKTLVVAAPYLDLHGEEDEYLRRGRPLRLVPARLERPTAIWRAGALDFNAGDLHTPSIFDDDVLMLE